MVLDCAHGAAYKVAPMVFSELGAELELIGAKPDSTNINRNCGALYPEVVAQKVKETGADIGLALDGDGDRAILVDEKGKIVDGDKVLAICADYLQKEDKLKNNTVVGTVMSNFGLEICLKERGIKLLRTKVGDRYITEALRAGKANIGGEPSGHVIFLDYHTTGDGILTALQVLKIMNETGKPLSELASIMQPTPQVLINVRVKERPPFDTVPTIKKAVEAAKQALNGKGRIVLRYSGTEPVARIMVEGENEFQVKALAEAIAEAVQKAIGE